MQAASEDEQGWQTVPTRHRKNKQPADLNTAVVGVEKEAEASTTKRQRKSQDGAPPPKQPRVIPFALPHVQDHIFGKAREAIIKHNRKSFAHFTDPLRLYAFERVGTTYSGDDSNAEELALSYHQSGNRIAFKFVRSRLGKGKYDLLLWECQGRLAKLRGVAGQSEGTSWQGDRRGRGAEGATAVVG